MWKRFSSSSELWLQDCKYWVESIDRCLIYKWAGKFSNYPKTQKSSVLTKGKKTLWSELVYLIEISLYYQKLNIFFYTIEIKSHPPHARHWSSCFYLAVEDCALVLSDDLTISALFEMLLRHHLTHKNHAVLE